MEAESMRRVLIIYTGGTIGMKPTPDGLRPVPQYLGNQLAKMPQFHDPGQSLHTTPVSRLGRRISYTIHEWETLLDSSNMTSADWVHMIQDIEADYDNYDAFIIIHGTDTMAYTASGLAMMIENLSKTVILTGAQVPFAMEPNDATSNLLGALMIAGHFDIPEVCVFFDHKLMRGCRTRKVDALAFDAFKSANFPELATVGTEFEINWQYVRDPPLPDQKPVFHKSLCPHVGVLKLFPGISDAVIRNFLQAPLEGCVLETYGSGNAPDNRKEFLQALKDASDRGVVIVNVTQCHKGVVQDYTYATGVALARSGVLSGFDMTTEAALAKLSYILARDDFDLARRRQLISKNLRGELTPPHGTIRYSFRDEAFIQSVAKALAQQEQSPDAAIQKQSKDLKKVIFPVLLCSAAGEGLIANLQSLLKSGADLNQADYDGRAPIHIAAAEGQLKVVQWLVEHGARVDCEDRWGGTPIYDAIRAGHTHVVEYLRGAGAKELSDTPGKSHSRSSLLNSPRVDRPSK